MPISSSRPETSGAYTSRDRSLWRSRQRRHGDRRIASESPGCEPQHRRDFSAQQKYAVGRNAARFGQCTSCGVRHWRPHRVREDRTFDAIAKARLISAAAGDCFSQPLRRDPCYGSRHHILFDWADNSPFVHSESAVCDRDHRGECSGRTPPDRTPVAGHGRSADGPAKRRDPAPPGSRDARFGNGDLYRQNWHTDRESDACP